MFIPLNSAIFEPSESSIWNLVIWIVILLGGILYAQIDKENERKSH